MTEVLSGAGANRLLLAPVTLLHAITSNDRLRAAQALEAGLDCDHRFKYGAVDQPAVNICAEKGRIDIMKLLIARGCSLNQRDSDGFSPLHSAVLLGHTAVVCLLLQHRASPNSRNIHRQTPLHTAAECGRLDVARLLLQAHADPNVADSSGRTPLMNACARGDDQVALLLLRHGATAGQWSHAGDTALHLLCSQPVPAGQELVSALLAAGARLEACSGRRYTPLHVAVLARNSTLVLALLAAGANPDAVNEMRQSVLLLATQTGRADLVRQLLLRGADPCVADVMRRTPLSAAASIGSSRVLELLLAFGVRPPSAALSGGRPRAVRDSVWRRLEEVAREPPPLAALCRRSLLTLRLSDPETVLRRLPLPAGLCGYLALENDCGYCQRPMAE